MAQSDESALQGRCWWELKDTCMLFNLMIAYRVNIKGQYQGPSANFLRDLAMEKVVGEFNEQYK